MRDGVTEQQFISWVWACRETENPRAAKSTGDWPFKRVVKAESNVRQIGAARK
jgi:hypothetical protein